MKLSIALCTYNGERFLAEQLQSYTVQKRLPDELVVCDDNSIDGTLEILRHFAKDARFPVHIYENRSNLGFIKNFEQAAAKCSGDIILYSDQDDVWLPERLALVEDAFAKSPSAGVLVMDATVVEQNLRPIGRSLWELKRFDRRLQRMAATGRAVEMLMQCNGTYLGMSIAFRTAYRELLLPFASWGHDRWTVLLIAFVADIILLPKPTALYRQHSENVSGGVHESSSVAQLKAAVFSERSKTRKETYIGRTKIFKALLGRLRELPPSSEMGAKLRLLEGKIAHLESRAAIPANRLMRAPSVVRELLTGNYFKYSGGFRDVAKDLLERDRPA